MIPDDTDWKFIARPFTSGTHPQGYVLQGAKIDLELGSSSRNAVVGIYSSGDIINVNDKLLGDKLYDLNGSISSAGVRTFSAPLGAVLNANTTYFLLIQSGSGNGTFALATTSSPDVDSSSQSGWSMGRSLYTYNNNESIYYPGGLKAEIFGINKSANSIATGKPSIEGLVQVNKTLTANVSRISDSNGIPVGSFVYQWVRVDGGEETNISGANESTYTVVDADEGNRLKVVVSFVDSAGVSEGPLVSDATALVSALVNNPPVFSSSSSFSVNENTVSVGTVVASDPDNQDSVTGYSVSGGAGSAHFSITNSGVLTFNSAPDYEAPADSGGNNVYNVVVTATSGTGGRVRTASQSIAVTVDNVDEAPSVPSAPVLSSPSSTSLSVSWSAPSNTGPAD